MARRYPAGLDSLKPDLYAAGMRSAWVSLVEELRAALGADAVIADPTRLAVYECDAYTLERHLPDVVVLPRSTEQVVQAVRVAARHRCGIIPRGAGTSLSGAVLPVDGGVMIGTARMNRVLTVDARNRRALVEAGCINADISAAARPYGLHFAPDPSSQMACTIGGNVAMNSGGPHTLKYGVTTNHVLGLELVLPDGEVVWLGATPDSGDDVDGYDLRGVVIGCEGMFGVVTRVLVRLVPLPPAWRTMLAIFPGVEAASQAVSAMIAAGIVPAALEMMDQLITQAVEEAYRFGFPVDAGAVLIIELDGLEAGLDDQAGRVETLCRHHGASEVRRARTETERAELWKCRKRAFGAVGRLSPSFLTQDGVVPRSRLPQIMRHIQAVSARYGLRIPNVFHAGDGNIHPLILFDDRDPDQVRRAVAAGNEILEHCLALGGSVTGEHGIGVEKIDFMERQFRTVDLDVMRAVRRVFDPAGRCNPHKMFPGSKRCVEFQARKQVAA